ncbi:MAG: His/Gly/Thr/Pro-type tRNA ligase C-terminal domain-containing protein, partial [Minisyncoccia bacterium]
DYPFGRKELYGLAYRGDYDLKNHKLSYFDEENKENFIPHVIEPTFGHGRTMLAVLLSAYKEEGDRVYLSLKPEIAPVKIAVFPLLKNKENLVKKAKEVYAELRKTFYAVEFDDRGNIGKRYYSQDEIGTPYCVTIDFESLEKNDVTLRDRDTTKQIRIPIDKLKDYLKEKLNQ